MQHEFDLKREQDNQLFWGDYNYPYRSIHFHSQIELYFVDEGEVTVWINDKQSVLKAGEASVALSYDAHGYQMVIPSKARLIIIPTYMCEEFIQAIQNKRVSTPFIRDKEAVKKINDCYVEITSNANNRIKTIGYIYVLLGLIIENMNFETLKDPIDPSLSSQILFYINENYKKNISLSSIASSLGYSASYVSRYFKSSFNTSVNKYITLIRLKEAVILMNEKNHNITYCAYESGFNSMRTFYRAFYDEFKCTPKEYLESTNTNN
jgi:AraC-like DNA-binding protein